MSKSVITDSLLTAIADAIRAKTGDDDMMTPAEMAQAIEDLPEGATEPYVEYTFEGGSVKTASLYGLTQIPSYFFGHTTSSPGNLNSIVIPEGVVGIGRAAFLASGLHQISLPSTLTLIGQEAFANCAFTQISLPSGVREIQTDAFKSCTSLTSIVLPEALTNVGSSIFSGCTYLVSCNVPSGMTVIPAYCFNGCTRLVMTEIPAYVTQISAAAFQNCKALTAIDILGATDMPYSSVFGGCTNLKTVRFHDTPSTIHVSAFPTAVTNIYVPWASGAVAGAPWGATNASIHYDTQYDADGNVIS